MKNILWAIALVLLTACNEDSTTITGPTLPPAPPPLEEPEPPPEPVDPGVEFSLDNTRGILLFAGTQGTEAQVRGLDNFIKSLGWPTITYNVCSETTDWRGGPWAVGPGALTKENLDNLYRFLRVTSEAGSQVRLNIFCTLRDNEAWMDLHAEDYAVIVANIAKEFNHVYISIGNEIQHTGSWFQHHTGRIRLIRDVARMAGFQGLIGADDGIGCAGCSYKYQYTRLGFMPDFHPWRNPDPNARAMREIVRVNGLPLMFSETTCYSNWREDRLCTKSREQILTYMHRAEREGIVWFFHSTDGLQWPTVVSEFDWIPN